MQGSDTCGGGGGGGGTAILHYPYKLSYSRKTVLKKRASSCNIYCLPVYLLREQGQQLG